MNHELGFISQQKQETFLFTTMSIPASGAHSAFHPVIMNAVSLRNKKLVFEADYSPPSSAEVKNAWSYTSVPPYIVFS
jgi:hypothetical protein